MFIRIDDAPFTPEQKAKIKAMGIIGADWGYPKVVLPDPVAYFEKQDAATKKLFKPGAPAGLTHYEKNENAFEKP